MLESDFDRGEGSANGRTALVSGLVLESAEALRLASELVADHTVRARLSRHADALMTLPEAKAARV